VRIYCLPAGTRERVIGAEGQVRGHDVAAVAFDSLAHGGPSSASRVTDRGAKAIAVDLPGCIHLGGGDVRTIADPAGWHIRATVLSNTGDQPKSVIDEELFRRVLSRERHDRVRASGRGPDAFRTR
jgi:hypothetical protein